MVFNSGLKKNQTTGIILCGGKSSRIGKNKGLIKLGNCSLLEHAVEALKPLCNKIMISSSSKDFKNLPYPLIEDIYTGIGPISGIYSTLKHSDTEHNLIISCDTPFLTANAISFILENSLGYDIVLPEFKGHVQSLTGYFNKSILGFIEAEIKKEHYKPIQLFKSLNIKILTIDQTLDFYRDFLFLNVNTLEEYEEASRIYQNISS